MRLLATVVVSVLTAGSLLVGGADAAVAGPADGRRVQPVALSVAKVLEDAAVGTPVGALSARGPRGSDGLKYRLVAGQGDRDNGLFRVSARRLVVAGPLDHETAPALQVRVQVTDAKGWQRADSLTITVADANDAPTDVVLMPATVDEDAVPAVVGTLAAVDEDADDTFTYALVAGAGDQDNDDFQVLDDQVVTAEALDFETQPTDSIRVRVTDAAGATYARALTISVTDIPEAAPALTLLGDSVAENAAPGTQVGRVTVSDRQWHRYTLVSGSPFALSSDGVLTTTAALDHESTPTKQVQVVATDSSGGQVTQVFTVRVTNVNEAPTGLARTTSTYAYTTQAGAVFSGLRADDPDVGDTLTFSLAAPSTMFSVAPDGSMRLIDGTPRSGDFYVPVTVTDAGGLSQTESIYVYVYPYRCGGQPARHRC